MKRATATQERQKNGLKLFLKKYESYSEKTNGFRILQKIFSIILEEINKILNGKVDAFYREIAICALFFILLHFIFLKFLIFPVGICQQSGWPQFFWLQKDQVTIICPGTYRVDCNSILKAIIFSFETQLELQSTYHLGR